MGKTENLPERLKKYVEKFEDLILFLLQKSHFFADFDAVRGAERKIDQGTIFDFFYFMLEKRSFTFFAWRVGPF